MSHSLAAYTRARRQVPEKPFAGADAVVFGLAGKIKRLANPGKWLMKDAAECRRIQVGLEKVSDAALDQEIRSARLAIRLNDTQSKIKAVAIIAEVARRTLGLTPFQVQLAAAMAMFEGFIAQVATGEGKSLIGAMAGVALGWRGRSCHILTVNDYLVSRDADFFRTFFHRCGIEVGCVTSEMQPDQRRSAYQSPVVYTTAKELLADYLRDHIKHTYSHRSPARELIGSLIGRSRAEVNPLVPALHTVIVDEADSILIDEAVTPLIISARQKNEELCDAIRIASRGASEMRKGKEFEVDEGTRQITLTRKCRLRLSELQRQFKGVWSASHRAEELIVTALKAQQFFHRGKDYIVEDGKVVIVDGPTGRPMPQRSWRQGLHQAVEAKEGLDVTDPTEIQARISFQRFFRSFVHLCGMTGTTDGIEAELWKVYGKRIAYIPTNRPCIRKEIGTRILVTTAKRDAVLVQRVAELHATGQPILIGTRHVETSIHLSEKLECSGIPCQVLNATKLDDEAEIVSAAGQLGAVTIATNMAGRGTDIKLGDGVSELGGLHIIMTERHESHRVDRQLIGRASRQGDPGSWETLLSMDDELLAKHLPTWLPRLHFIRSPQFHWAQKRAQRRAQRQRVSVQKQEDLLSDRLAFGSAEL